MPDDGVALVRDRHDCLNLRFPGAKEFQWTLQTVDGPKRFEITGPLESDDGDVLTGWALNGAGIVMKPIFEVADHLRRGALVPVATATPPLPTQLACLSPSRKYRDPKVQRFSEVMIAHCKDALAALDRITPLSPSERT
jgi:DNA-binding transcriptional LysR family regulator